MVNKNDLYTLFVSIMLIICYMAGIFSFFYFTNYEWFIKFIFCISLFIFFIGICLIALSTLEKIKNKNVVKNVVKNIEQNESMLV